MLGFVGAEKSGEQQKLFQQLLLGVEEYDAEAPASRLAAKQGLPELLNYVRHQTALGQPFTRQALQAGRFEDHQIGQLHEALMISRCQGNHTILTMHRCRHTSCALILLHLHMGSWHREH